MTRLTMFIIGSIMLYYVYAVLDAYYNADSTKAFLERLKDVV